MSATKTTTRPRKKTQTKAPQPPVRDPAPAPSIVEKAYTLEALVKRLGEATTQEVETFMEGYPPAVRIEEGRNASTGRIDTDAARLYGIAVDFLEHCTPEQRRAIAAVTPDFLRVGVWSAFQGHRLAKTSESSQAGLKHERDQRTGSAQSARGRALAGRNLLEKTLLALAAGTQPLTGRIQAAAAEPDLAEAIEKLVAIGRDVVARPSASLRARLKEAAMDAAWLDWLAALGAEARSSGEVAGGAIPMASVTQAEVDRWDGTNLILLDRLIACFESGNQMDPSVPRLVPIALRSYFGRRVEHQAPAAQPTPSPEPTPTPPPR
jgi:hypothetical protein